MPQHSVHSTQVEFISRKKALSISLILGAIAGALFWLTDTWLHFALGPGRRFFAELLHPSTVDFVPRVLVYVGATLLTWLAVKLKYDVRQLRFTQFTVEHAGDPILWIQRDASIFYANHSACTRLGHSFEELTRLRISDIDPLYPKIDWPAHWAELRSRKVLRFETLHKTRGGEIFPVEVTARHVIYRGQEFNCAFIRDITERKAAEQALKQSEERVRLILESTGEGIIGVDRQGRCAFTNPTARQLLGYEDDAPLIGASIHERIHHTRRDGSPFPQDQCPAIHAFTTQQRLVVEEDLFWRRDGSSFDVRYTVHPILRDGELAGAAYVFSDITEQKKAERALKKYSERLKEANRLKDLFTDILRHDLMNPAAAIKTSSELLIRIETDATKKKIAQNILSSTHRLIDQCESAAAYARVANAEAIAFEPLDLCGLLETTIQVFEPQLADKKIDLHYSPACECLARANPIIADVFSNLISNAIKYSPENTRIGIQVQEREGSWLISVSDQGPGIPDSAKGRIFTRFERLDRQGVKGSGLGLAIVKQVLDLHHGKVWVEDNEGGGSVFNVMLPKG